MSTSTVSVTANSRRRISSTVNDFKHSIEILNSSPTAAAAAKDNELSHSTSAAASPIKKSASSQTNSSAARTQTRTRTRKHVGPGWRVLVANLVVVILAVVLVTVGVDLVEKKGGGVSMSFLGSWDVESRISAVEKTSAETMQVQVGAMGEKFDSEVRNLRGEIGKRVEDKGVEFEVKLNYLRAKNEGLEAELGELRDVSRGFVTKDDVGRLYDELMSGEGGNFDEIRELAREIVEKEMEKHAGDGLGRVDYALASGGGRVIKHSEALLFGMGAWFGGLRGGVDENAVRMLSPSFGEPGMCFALKGSAGFVQIRLRNAIVPEAITLEHVAKSVAYDQSSAPKDCRVFAWLQGQQALDTDMNLEKDKVLLTEFTYDLEKSNAQTYSVVDSSVSAVIDTVRYEFSSNHGSPTHTCIYRLRVHGHDSESVTKIS